LASDQPSVANCSRSNLIYVHVSLFSECSAIAKPSPVALSVDGMMPVFQANPLPGGRPMQALAHLGFGLEDWLLSDLELMLDSSAGEF